MSECPDSPLVAFVVVVCLGVIAILAGAAAVLVAAKSVEGKR